MSVEVHPNINAAGFTIDIAEAFLERLRGKAAHDHCTALSILNRNLVQMVVDVSVELDQTFGDGVRC